MIVGFVLLLSFIATTTQEPEPESFFPSSAGDVWEYDAWIYGDYTGSYKRVIIKDSVDSDSSKFLFYNTVSTPLFKINPLLNVYYDPKNLNWF